MQERSTGWAPSQKILSKLSGMERPIRECDVNSKPCGKISASAVNVHTDTKAETEPRRP